MASKGRYEVLLLVTMVIWGCNFPVAKYAVSNMEPHLYNALRYTLSIVMLGVYLGFRNRNKRTHTRLHTSDLVRLVVVGLVGHACYQIFFIAGIRLTTAGASALLIASSPVWIAIFGRLFRVEQLAGKAWAALFIAFAGTAIVAVSRGSASGDVSLLGNVLILGAAASWGVATVVSKPLLHRISPTYLTFVGASIAVPVLWFLAYPALGRTDFFSLTPALWFAIFYSGFLSTGLAYVFWNSGVKQIGPSHTGIYGNLVPVVALISSHFALGEPILPVQIAGGALVLLGLAAMYKARASTTTTAAA